MIGEPGLTTGYQYLVLPLPLPSRVSFGFFVTVEYGVSLVHNFTCFFKDRLNSSFTASIWFEQHFPELTENAE